MQMFVTDEELRAFVERMTVELHATAAEDDRYFYVAFAKRPSTAPGMSIRLERPREHAGALTLVRHGIVSDDSELIRLFDQMRRRWNRLLSRPVRASNAVHGGSSVYRDIGFTAGAWELLASGST